MHPWVLAVANAGTGAVVALQALPQGVVEQLLVAVGVAGTDGCVRFGAEGLQQELQALVAALLPLLLEDPVQLAAVGHVQSLVVDRHTEPVLIGAGA